MKIFVKLFLSVYLLLNFTSPAIAQEQNPEDILAQRGKGVVTQRMFAARADQIPEHLRLGALRDGNRFRDLLNDALLKAQLAEDAREAGFDQEPMIKDRMQLAALSELANAWLEHYVKTQAPADYEQLALEYYQLNQDKILTSPKINVSHILISNTERSDEEALALALTVYQQLIEDPDTFDQLVSQYSEDPSAKSNQGKFQNVKRGDMVKPFESAAFALEPGKISEPVKTEYGYHIIRLDAHIAPEKMPFEEVKNMLVEKQREKHEERVKMDYLNSLTSVDVKITQEALEEMVRRQFGDDYVEPEFGNGKKE